MSASPAVIGLAGLTAGVTTYLLYFQRYECHMNAFLYLYSFLGACIGSIVVLVKSYGWNSSSATLAVASATVSFIIGVYGSLLTYRLFFHPLNRFPGPYAARISSLWLGTQLGKSDGYYWLDRMHKKYGKFVRIGSNDISITDPDAMETAYGPKSSITKAAWYDSDHPLTSLHTTRDRTLHDRRRRVWAPAFSEKAVREYELEVRKFNDKIFNKFGEFNGEPVDVSKWFNLFSFDVMGLLAFGREYGMLEHGEKPHAIELLDEGMQPLAYRLPSWLFRMMTRIPGLGAGYQKFVQFCIGELTWRVKNADKAERKSDIIGWLLKAYKDVKNPEKDVMLQADARLIIVAGSDTTAATFTYLFYHLAQNPDVVQKLREELDPLTRNEWHDSDIRGCEYLNGCINEALRLHPPVPSGVSRLTPPEGMKVGDTWVPGKVTFITPQYPMGRDDDIYPQADKFIPERWSSQGEKIKHKDAFAPFSTGPYGCIGKNLALMEIRTLTTRLALAYDMKLAKGEDGSKLVNASKDHFTMELAGLLLTFTPRK